MGAHSGQLAKRFSVLLLVLGMVSVVAACGGNDASPAATSGTSPPPTSGTIATPTSDTLSRGEVARLFHYDRRRPLAITRLGLTVRLPPARELDGVTVRSITYASPKGGEVPALVVVPRGKGPFPGVIVQHGLPDTKEGMLPAGIDLARTGAVAVLIDAPFNRPQQGRVRSDPLTFTPKDRDEQIQLIVDLRRAVDLLQGPGCLVEGMRGSSWRLAARRVRIGAMPTVPRRPAAQRERDRLEVRRLRAAELFAAGVRQAEVARQLEVSAQAVSVWHACWEHGGTEALRSRGPSGPAPRLSDAELATVEQALLEGATANGFVGELWTLERIALVIQRLTGVRHHSAHVWALLRHRLGWSVQHPVRRAAERDQAAIDRWVKDQWPQILQTPNGAEPVWSSSMNRRSA